MAAGWTGHKAVLHGENRCHREKSMLIIKETKRNCKIPAGHPTKNQTEEKNPAEPRKNDKSGPSGRRKKEFNRVLERKNIPRVKERASDSSVRSGARSKKMRTNKRRYQGGSSAAGIICKLNIVRR